MQKKSFAEMVEREKNIKFSMPHNVRNSKLLLSNGRWGYVFRHDELGELGRILILPHDTESQIVCEVLGEPDDPMTEKRRAVLEPISRDILDGMAFICGDGTGKPKPYVSPKEIHGVVRSQVYPCDICGVITSMLIFAPDADTKAGLEDYACMMYSKIKKLNVSTWIVGTETEFIVNGEDVRKSLVLKVHPEREEAKIMTPDEVMDKIDKLMDMHCKK